MRRRWGHRPPPAAMPPVGPLQASVTESTIMSPPSVHFCTNNHESSFINHVHCRNKRLFCSITVDSSCLNSLQPLRHARCLAMFGLCAIRWSGSKTQLRTSSMFCKHRGSETRSHDQDTTSHDPSHLPFRPHGRNAVRLVAPPAPSTCFRFGKPEALMRHRGFL